MTRRVAKPVFVILAVAVLLGLGLAGFYYGRIVPLIKAGKQAGVYGPVWTRPDVRDFSFETQDGLHRSIADLKGKVVVVDVWATWCAPCLHSMPKFVELRNKYRDRPVEILGVDVDDGGWAKVKPFLQEHSAINYTLAVPDASHFQYKTIVDLNPLGNVSVIPTVFIIDRQGRLAAKFVEAGHEKEVDALVARLLDE